MGSVRSTSWFSRCAGERLMWPVASVFGSLTEVLASTGVGAGGNGVSYALWANRDALAVVGLDLSWRTG